MNGKGTLNESAFLLQRRPYSESSLLVDFFTEGSGRVTVVAKGARRLKSKFRGVLQPFQEVVVQYSGKGEVKTLRSAEPAVSRAQLFGAHLLCGFYMNELIIRMLYRYDPHEKLYSAYRRGLDSLGSDDDAECTLRKFEKNLLEEAGYGLHLLREADTGKALRKETVYRYLPETGPVARDDSHSGGILIHGDALLALEYEDGFTDRMKRELKKLSRIVLALHLQGRPLHSRRMYSQLYPETRHLAVARDKTKASSG